MMPTRKLQKMEWMDSRLFFYGFSGLISVGMPSRIVAISLLISSFVFSLYTVELEFQK